MAGSVKVRMSQEMSEQPNPASNKLAEAANAKNGKNLHKNPQLTPSSYPAFSQFVATIEVLVMGHLLSDSGVTRG